MVLGQKLLVVEVFAYILWETEAGLKLVFGIALTPETNEACLCVLHVLFTLNLTLC